MLWLFRALVAINGLLLAASFLYHAPGEDAAGAGLRLGFALIYAVGFAIVLLLGHFIHTDWMRAIAIVILTVPLLLFLYGIVRSL